MAQTFEEWKSESLKSNLWMRPHAAYYIGAKDGWQAAQRAAAEDLTEEIRRRCGDEFAEYDGEPLDIYKRVIEVEHEAQLRRVAEMLNRATNNRCVICGWTLATYGNNGCIRGNCSYRPEAGSAEYERIRPYRDLDAIIKQTK